MALTAPKGNGASNVTQPNLAPAVYPARLVQIIDFGLQAQRPYQGKDKPAVQEIGLTYELLDEFMVDDKGNPREDKPRWVSETLPFYGLYADKAKSTQRYLTFDPNQEWGGDFSKALGMPVNVAIVNNKTGDRVYDNVASTAAMRPKDVEKCAELKNEPKLFDLDNPDMEVFNKLPKWIQEKIQGNLKYKGSILEGRIGSVPVQAAPKPQPAESESPFKEEDSNSPY